MATLYRTDGTTRDIKADQPNGSFSLKKMQALVGGYIETVGMHDGKTMVINEDGKLMGLTKNVKATQLVHDVIMDDDYISGPALVCSEKEMGD